MVDGVSEKPKVNQKANAGIVVPETTDKPSGEVLDEVVIVIRIPKPEALIFAGKMQSRYDDIPLERNFAVKIMEPIKTPPF